ncbi:GNAT family N-acetyltransferase [Brachybacterium nesterenkovii]|uniref:GCN5-related N-acetyltransferase n=1 Tax=Brachybacterium nesterenkovii TaxID=47847 RepID=A0A1X6X1Y7_9MICO|nr:GNAT family N-acetyltransferase [Brachybacterium nesterenkovii]SLM91665.1 GCN5-related N-acetyltransferase [Brachybacterium nesterenkovii]
MFRVRPAASGDIEAIRRIEVAAGEMFRGIGMDEIADDDPPTRGEIARAIESRGAWAAVDAADRPVGYLVASRLQGSLHVDQVTVHPDAARRGIGRRLISAADACAEAEGTGALTLTTFARVPWNAPYYRRLGFSEMGADGLPEDLAAVVAHEASLGLARWPRVVMRRECGAIRPPGRS